MRRRCRASRARRARTSARAGRSGSRAGRSGTARSSTMPIISQWPGRAVLARGASRSCRPRAPHGIRERRARPAGAAALPSPSDLQDRQRQPARELGDVQQRVGCRGRRSRAASGISPMPDAVQHDQEDRSRVTTPRACASRRAQVVVRGRRPLGAFADQRGHAHRAAAGARRGASRACRSCT